MTREDAIKTLKELWRETNDPWYEEVYNMAINALETDRKTEPQISPSDCKTCKHNPWSTPRTCGKCIRQEDGRPSMYEPEDEPQTERSE